jgi:hypothetical protein
MMTAKINAATSQLGAHGAKLFQEGMPRQRTLADFFPHCENRSAGQKKRPDAKSVGTSRSDNKRKGVRPIEKGRMPKKHPAFSFSR